MQSSDILQSMHSLGWRGAELPAAFRFTPGVTSRRKTCGPLPVGVLSLGLAYRQVGPSDPDSKACNVEFVSTMCSVIRPLLTGRDYDPAAPKTGVNSQRTVG